MKRIVAIVSFGFVLLVSGCNPVGESRERYTFINRKQAILVADTQTGEMFRMVIAENGGTTWQKLGSPKNAK